MAETNIADMFLDEMIDLLKYKGFRRVSLDQWIWQDFNRWILIDLLDQDNIAVNFNDENYYVQTPKDVCNGLKQFNKV